VRDVVGNLFHRLGMVGAIVLASALIFGAVAGGVIVHRLDTTPSASSEQGQGAEQGDKAEKSNKSQGQAMKQKHANSNGQKNSSKSKETSQDGEDKDA
jgi:uncharacterized membrane protein